MHAKIEYQIYRCIENEIYRENVVIYILQYLLENAMVKVYILYYINAGRFQPLDS